MPWLVQHGDGWRVRWREGNHTRQSSVMTKTAAKAELVARADDLRAKRKPGSLVLSWADMRKRWLAHLKERGRTTAYIQKCKDTLERCTAAWKTTADATPEAMGRLKLGQWRMAKSCLRWARTYHGQAVDHAAIGRWPGKVVRRPTPDLLTDDQVAELVGRAAAAGGACGRLLAHMAATYGHRPQSLVAITIADVDLAGGRITMPVKSGDIHRHPVLPETIALAKAAMGTRTEGPLLLDPLGKPWKSGQKASAWFWHQAGAERIKKGEPRAKPIGTKQLKCYAISRMLAAGLDLKTVASITGHRTPVVLLRYARVNEDRQRAALRALSGGTATHVLPTESVTH